MFDFLSKKIGQAFNRAKAAIVLRCKTFTPWDYLLGISATATPIILGLPPQFSVLSLLVTGSCLLIPRSIAAPTYKQDVTPAFQQVSKIIEEIVKKRGLKAPEYLFLRNPNSPSIHVDGITTSDGKHCLIIHGNISILKESELSILIEHELSHFHFNDPQAISYTSRLHMATFLLSLVKLENHLPMALGLNALVFMFKQASRRYRENRADHFAIQNSDNDIDPNKVIDLQRLVTTLHNNDMQQKGVVAEPRSFLDRTRVHCLKSYADPRTMSEKVTNRIINLMSTHPTPYQRKNINPRSS